MASFHGMPQEYVDKGDPYQAQCVATTEALRKRMGLDASKLLLTFQSRFGFDEWLQPYTDKTMERLAKEGVRRIAVVTPGFSADCLETLEEIAQENAEIFKHNGGEQFASIPASTTASPAWTSSASWCCASCRAGFERSTSDPVREKMHHWLAGSIKHMLARCGILTDPACIGGRIA